MDRDQAAIRPVVNVERLLILRRELRAVAERHAGRAADPDDGDRRIAVGIVLGPLGAPLAEAAVAAAHRVEDADRAVPRSAPVPFHVAVEAEELAVGVERDVVGVALARGDELGILAVGIEPDDVAAGRLVIGAEAVSVLRAREDAVVGIVAMGRAREDVLGHAGEVAVHAVELPVRAEHNAVRPVLAGAALPFAEKLDLVVLVGALRVLAAEEAEHAPSRVVLPVAIHVERVEGVEHPHRLADGELEVLFLLDSPIPQREARDRLPALAAQQEPPLVVFGQADPGAMNFRIGLEDVLDLEVGKGLELVRRVLLSLKGHRRREHRGGDKPEASRSLSNAHGIPFPNEGSLPGRTALPLYAPQPSRDAPPPTAAGPMHAVASERRSRRRRR